MLAQGPGMVMAPAAYKDPENFKPIGAGPFVFDHYSPGEELVLNANKDYWNGAPHLDALRFVWLGAVDDTPKLEALKSGAADTAFIRDPKIIAKAISEDGTGGMMYSTGLGAALWINMREGRPGTDPRVREALNLAFDPVAFVERVAGGAGQPTKLLYPETSAWATDVTPPAADPEKAKELLSEAMADGYDGKISYTYGADAESQTEAVTLKAIFEAVGFKVELVPLRSVADQVQKLYIDHDFDLAVGAGSMLDVDPYAALSSILFSQSGSNNSGYVSEEMDGLLNELRTVAGPEDGKPVMTKIQELWDKDIPGIGISGGGTFTPWNDNVHGIKPTTETLLLYDKAWKS
jgi:peptide/nickel transport system substrate-binding protein